MASSDSADSDDDHWSFIGEPPVKKRKLTNAVAEVKRQNIRVKSRIHSVPVVMRPVGTWQAPPKQHSQFQAELLFARHRYVSQRCSGATLNTFCFDVLTQSGWRLKDGRFFLETCESSCPLDSE